LRKESKETEAAIRHTFRAHAILRIELTIKSGGERSFFYARTFSCRKKNIALFLLPKLAMYAGQGEKREERQERRKRTHTTLALHIWEMAAMA